jgi:hypothetical protein
MDESILLVCVVRIIRIQNRSNLLDYEIKEESETNQTYPVLWKKKKEIYSYKFTKRYKIIPTFSDIKRKSKIGHITLIKSREETKPFQHFQYCGKEKIQYYKINKMTDLPAKAVAHCFVHLVRIWLCAVLTECCSRLFRQYSSSVNRTQESNKFLVTN